VPDLEHGVGLVTNNSWSETGVTWNNQSVAGKRFASWISGAGAVVEFVVTPQVLDALSGDKQLSVQLHSIHPSPGAGNVEYASREHPEVNRRPQLRLLVAGSPRPRITGLVLSGANLLISGTNGVPNSDYYVLVSTNLALPLGNWTRVATNRFDASGNFSFTQPVNFNQRQQFHRLLLP
jgi:hypothetical protein